MEQPLMPHGYVIYFFCTLLVGCVSLGMTSVANIRAKNDWMPYYVYFYSVFTLLIGVGLSMCYLIVNLPLTFLAHATAIQYFSICIITPLLTLSIPVLAFAAGDLLRRNQQRLVLFGIVVGIETFVQHVLVFTSENFPLCGTISDMTILGVLVSTVWLGQQAKKHLDDAERQALVKRVLLLLGIAGLFQLMDIVLSFFVSFLRLYPLVYCAIGVTVAYHALRALRSVSDAKTIQRSAPSETPSNISNENAEPNQTELYAAEMAEYNLSEREQDILTLVLKGCTNREIAELNYCSLSTVKACLTKIYDTVGVKNRYELIASFSTQHFPPETQSDGSSSE